MIANHSNQATTPHSYHAFSYSDLGINRCSDNSIIITFTVRSVHVNPADEGNATSTAINIPPIEDSTVCEMPEQSAGICCNCAFFLGILIKSIRALPIEQPHALVSLCPH